MKRYMRRLSAHTLSAKIAVTTMLAMALAAPSFAVSPSQVLRVLDNRTVTGSIAPLGETVSLNLGATPVPVVVTWQGDVANVGRELMTISINGGSCGAFGGGQIPYFLQPSGYAPNGYNNISMQWVVFPSDGLIPGTNTINLCAGSLSGDSFLLGYRTLTVRKGN